MIRRAFLRRTAAALGGIAAGGIALAPAARALPRVDAALAAGAGAPDDEVFWAEVRAAFDLHPTVVNLDHGWTSPAPRAAVDVLAEQARALEALPADRLANTWVETTNTTVRAAIGEAVGVPGDQLALVRNATEALDTILLGVPLERGDEVVCSPHDYYAMLDALDQRARRDGVVRRRVDLPVPAPSMDALFDAYAAALSPRTRLVLLTHPSNLTGQLLPVRRIADAAHAVGAEVVVDGAQSLGLIPESPVDLGADFYGASLHKWLGAPVGMGVLWMRPEHAARVWPLVPSPAWVEGMARFEWIGTNPEYVGPAVAPALALHTRLGAARKAARLRYLAGRVREQVAAVVPGARFYTTADPAMSAGLTVVDWPGLEAEVAPGQLRVQQMQQRLFAEHGVLVQAMTGMAHAPHVHGLRVSPNVFSSPAEIGRLGAALGAVLG